MAYAPPPGNERRSRFNLTSIQARDFNALIKQLEATRKRKGAFYDRNHLRATIAKARTRLEVPRDDVVRFLLNEHIVIDHDDGRFYFDGERARVILDCVTRHIPTTPPSDKGARVAAIIAASERNVVEVLEEEAVLDWPAGEASAAAEAQVRQAPPPTLEDQVAAARLQVAALRRQFGR